MKKILILVKSIRDREGYFRDFVQSELEGKVEIVMERFEDVMFSISQGSVEVRIGEHKLEDFNAVYFKRMGKKYMTVAFGVACLLKQKGVPFVDASMGEMGALGSKMTDLVKLALAGMPVPESFYVSRQKTSEFRDDLISKFGVPMYSKNTFSQRREGIFIIKEQKDFDTLLGTSGYKGFIFQKFMHIEKEYRLVVMGGKVVALHEEVARKFEGNKVAYDTGESATGFIDPSHASQEMLDLAVRATQVLNLDVSGVDACVEKGTGKIYIFEVNRGPGLTQDPEISPELPEMAKFLAGLVK